MLDDFLYKEKFSEIQKCVVEATDVLINEITPGKSEKEIAEIFGSILSNRGFDKHWYPIMISSGENTSKVFSRRVHLPSESTVIKENDIIIVDSTPIKGTIWANWCKTTCLGINPFFTQLSEDCNQIVDEIYSFALNKAVTIGDIYDFGLEVFQKRNLTLIGGNLGHSIFQVPEGQTVDKTPLSQRVFIDKNHDKFPLKGILSIEPQLCRTNPKNGEIYGAKQQRILIFDA